MPFTWTLLIDGPPGVGTEILAGPLNDLAAKVGDDASAVATSLDYLLKNPASLEPGHKHIKLWAPDGSVITLATNANGVAFGPGEASLVQDETDFNNNEGWWLSGYTPYLFTAKPYDANTESYLIGLGLETQQLNDNGGVIGLQCITLLKQSPAAGYPGGSIIGFSADIWVDTPAANLNYQNCFESLAGAVGQGFVKRLSAYQGYVIQAGSGIIQEACTFMATDAVVRGSGSITDSYGLLIDDRTSGVNNYAIKTGLGKVIFGDDVTLAKILNLTPLAAAPTSPVVGKTIACANRTNWDPLSKGSGGSYLVRYNDAGAWVAITAQ